MKLKKINPTTPSQRNLIKIKGTPLRKKPLIKTKILGLKNSSGRNNLGKITAFHKGGGHKQKYRKIDFHRKNDSVGIIASIEYDPNRNSNIASVYSFSTNSYYYIIAPKNLSVGDIIKSGSNAEPKIGHSLPISKIPVGSFIHNVSVKSNQKAQIARSAGTFCQLIEKTSKQGRIRLNSGEQRFLSINCLATIGIVSNDFFFLTTVGKAGRSRWLNKRPKVRGVAMNPIDHPHGGGEGKTSGGRTSVSPWGKPTKGGKTSRSVNNLIIVKRNK
jgi:large subunit ribosomal protein L2